jgi:hypothetical protein
MSAARRAARPEVLAEVSEWAAEEVAVALSMPVMSAETLLARSLTMVHRLPGTLAGLESGLLHLGHLWPLLDKIGVIADDALRTSMETDLLAWMGRRAGTTAAQLGAKIRRELLARNLRDAARELADQLRRRGVHLRPDRVDGMANLSVLLLVPEAAALVEALGAYADALVDDPAAGPPRTRQQKMADCLMDLVLRPGQTDLPTVRAQVTVVAPVGTLLGGDQPAEVAGQPVPAEVARTLAQGMGLLPSPATDDDRDAEQNAAPAEQTRDAEAEEEVAPGGWPVEDPPEHEQERLWNETAAALAADPEWAAMFGFAPDPDPDPDPDVGPLPVPAAPGALSGPEPEPSWWAAADAAVDEAGAAQLALDRALSRARRAVDWAELADRADSDAGEESAEARISTAGDALAALAHASAAARAGLAGLLQRTGGGGLTDRPRIALTDALTGALLALTDAPGLRAAGTCGARACRTGRRICDHDLTGRPGLGPPPECAGYRPGAELERFLRARDRRCRQPGCRQRVGELDHHIPWPDGPTAASNMNGFCERHHRGKHQAPGFDYQLTPTGELTVTTPTGTTATTEPPPF